MARGSAHVRRTRRRGHDLASVTLACSVGADGTTRLAYGSVGPRPLLVVDDSGVLADPAATDAAKLERLDALFVDATPVADLDAGEPRVPARDAAGPRAARARTARERRARLASR